MATPAEASGKWEQRAALCGIAFVVLFVVGFVLAAAGRVDLDGTAAEVAARYDGNQTMLLPSERILVLAVFFFFPSSVGSGARFGGWKARAGD